MAAGWLLGLALAYANGANDNFKGVATIHGSGLAGFRVSLAWATICTAAGCLAAVFMDEGLLAAFTGKGLVPPEAAGREGFMPAVAFAAAATVLLATRFGFPISTTHALLGALAGAGWAASPEGLHLDRLAKGFVLPLLLSPAISMTAAVAAWLAFARGQSRVPDPPPAGPGSAPEKRRLRDGLHFLSAGTASFARGLNDAPKIAAILAAPAAMGTGWAIALTGAAMAAGGLIQSRRVAETMSRKVTEIGPAEGLAANLVTSALVLAASRWSLPVSTTHVSCGALFGIGAVTGKAHWPMIGGILASWLTTLPVAAALGAAGLFVIRAI